MGGLRLITCFLAFQALQEPGHHGLALADALCPPALHPGNWGDTTVTPSGGEAKVVIRLDHLGGLTIATQGEAEAVHVILLVVAAKDQTPLRAIHLKPASPTLRATEARLICAGIDEVPSAP